MTDTLPIPQLELPGIVDPRTGACSVQFIDFLRALAERTTDAATATELSAIVSRLEALEADDPPLRIFGTNGVQVFGSEDVGFEVRGPTLPSGRSGQRVIVVRESAPAVEPWPRHRRQTASGVAMADVAARVAYGA